MASAAPTRPFLVAMVKAVITASAIIVLFSQIDFSFFASHRHKLGALTLAASLALLASQTLLIAGLRLKLVLDALKQRRRLGETCQVALGGFFFEQVAFGFVGGDAMRLWLLHQTDVPLRSAIQAIAIDRCLGLFGLFLLALVGLPGLVALLTGYHWQVVAVTGMCIAAVAGPLALLLMMRLARRWASVPFVAEVIALVSAVVRGGGIRRRLLAAFVLASLTHCMNVFVFFLIGRDLGIDLSLGHWFLIVPPALLISMLPISAGGWGLREASFVLGLASFGIRPEEAILPPIIFGLGVLVAALPGGVVWLTSRKRASRDASSPIGRGEERAGDIDDNAPDPASGRAEAERASGYGQELARLS
jgi:glycosyltransferase 2 family protein